MKNSSMPNPFWKLKWNLGRKWALLWRWYQQLSENMTVNLRQLKRDYFTANYKFKAFEKFNNHRVQKRRVKSFFIHRQIDWNYSQRNYFSVIICFDNRVLHGKGRLDRKDTVSVLHPFFRYSLVRNLFFFFAFSLSHKLPV